MKVVLDTNIFNRILDGKFSLSEFPPESVFLATNIQLCELKNTKDSQRRSELVNTFEEVSPVIEAASFSWGVPGAGWAEANWSKTKQAAKLHAELQAIKPKLNNWQDALIAETALLNECTFVTADRILSEVSEKHGIMVRYVAT